MFIFIGLAKKKHALVVFFTRWELTACLRLIRLMSYYRWKILCKVTTNMDCSVQPEQVTFSHLPWIFVYSLFTSHMSQQNMKRNMLVKLVLDHLGIPIISQVQPNMDIYCILLNKSWGFLTCTEINCSSPDITSSYSHFLVIDKDRYFNTV